MNGFMTIFNLYKMYTTEVIQGKWGLRWTWTNYNYSQSVYSVLITDPVCTVSYPVINLCNVCDKKFHHSILHGPSTGLTKWPYEPTYMISGTNAASDNRQWRPCGKLNLKMQDKIKASLAEKSTELDILLRWEDLILANNIKPCCKHQGVMTMDSVSHSCVFDMYLISQNCYPNI